MRWPLGMELAAAGMIATSAATEAIARSAFLIVFPLHSCADCRRGASMMRRSLGGCQPSIEENPGATRTRSTSSSAARTAERFIEEIRGDDPQLAAPLRIEERELEAGGRMR